MSENNKEELGCSRKYRNIHGRKANGTENLINKTLRQKMKWAYQNQLLLPYDVTFTVTSESGETLSIGAHSFVLAISSPILDALLANQILKQRELPGNERQTIQLKVSRGDEKTVKCFLEILHCGKADLSDLNCQEVMDVMSLANEYKIADVIAKTSEYLVKLITVKNAVQILEFLNCTSCSNTRSYDRSFSKCFDFVLKCVLRHAKEILNCESFLNLSESNLRLLLASDNLTGVSELGLFEACFKWGQAKCDRQNLPPTKESLRTVLSDLLRYIRFPLMTPEEFSTFVVTRNILNKDELTDILVFFSVSELSKPSVIPKLFSTTPRISSISVNEGRRGNYRRFISLSSVTQVSSQTKPGQLNEISSSSLKDYLYKNNEAFVIINHKLHWNELISRFTREIPSGTRENIRSFILEKVQLQELMNPGEKMIKKIIRLPSLEEFTLNLTCEKENTKTVANSLKTNFCQYLFFLTRAKRGCPEYLWKLEVDILIKLNGVTLLEIDHKNNSLVMNGLKNHIKVLESCKNEDMSSLSISLESSRSNWAQICSPSLIKLAKLCIHNSSCIGRVGLLNPPLQNLCNLSELILHKCGFHSIDLALIAKSHLTGLKNLSISYAHVIATSEDNDEASLENLNLNCFTLWNCSWNNYLFKSLQYLRNLQSLCVNNDELSSRKLFPFIHLSAHRKWFAKELIVAGCVWGINGDNHDVSDVEGEVRLVRNLLERFQVSKNTVRLKLSNSFAADGTPMHAEQRCVTLPENMLTELMFERFGCNAFFESLACFEDNSCGQ